MKRTFVIEFWREIPLPGGEEHVDIYKKPSQKALD